MDTVHRSPGWWTLSTCYLPSWVLREALARPHQHSTQGANGRSLRWRLDGGRRTKPYWIPPALGSQLSLQRLASALRWLLVRIVSRYRTSGCHERVLGIASHAHRRLPDRGQGAVRFSARRGCRYVARSCCTTWRRIRDRTWTSCASELTRLRLAGFKGGPERTVVRSREISLDLRCGWCQRLHPLGEVVEERPERGAERGGESAFGKIRPVSLHDHR